MTRLVNVHEAKTHLSELLERVQRGEEVIVGKAGKPVARLVAYASRPARRKAGSATGKLRPAPDFDAPLPENVLREFEQ